jgi:hypothetical protein
MIAIQHLNPGTRIRLNDGAVAEIRENPRDGTWLIARRLSDGGESGEGEDLVHVDDIAEVVS